MSIDALRWALNVEVSCPADRTFLLVIANYANENNEAWPSYRTLKDKCVCSRSTVVRKIKSLEDRGYFTITQGLREDGSYSSNIYTLNIDLMKFGDSLGGVILTPPSTTQGETGSDHMDDTGGGVTEVNCGGVTAKEPQEPSTNHQSEPSKKENPNPNFEKELDEIWPNGKPDPKILPSNCQKPEKICKCQQCKRDVNRLCYNHKRLWAAKQYFDCPSANTLLEHWSDFNTAHSVDAILGEIAASIKRGEYREGQCKAFSTVIGDAVIALDYEEKDRQAG